MFDTLGDLIAQAFSGPMLIDGWPLEDPVIYGSSGQDNEQDLAKLDVTGLSMPRLTRCRRPVRI